MRFTYSGLMVPALSPIAYWEGVTDAYRSWFGFSGAPVYRWPARELLNGWECEATREPTVWRRRSLWQQFLWRLGWIYGRIRRRFW